MNKFLAISLALLIFGIAIRDFAIYASFKVNQDFIAEVLCINKDKPELACKGKCVFMQKIKASHEESDSSFPFHFEDRININLYITSISLQNINFFQQNISPNHLDELHGQLMVYDDFQPPQPDLLLRV